MKALSIRQPWVWAILHAGKDVENRDWNPTGRHMRDARGLLTSGSQFLLHASATMRKHDDYHACRDLMSAFDRPELQHMPKWGCWTELGGIVGVARFAKIADTIESPWFFGPVGLVLADVRSIKFTKLKGALGFFDVPDDIAREALTT